MRTIIREFDGLCKDRSKTTSHRFDFGAAPDVAAPRVDYLADRLRQAGVRHVEASEFGAMILVEIYNGGPSTIVLHRDELNR